MQECTPRCIFQRYFMNALNVSSCVALIVDSFPFALPRRSYEVDPDLLHGVFGSQPRLQEA